MKKLSLKIKEAKVTAFHVSLNEKGKPDISIYISLITEDGRKIANYSISTSSWGEDKIEVPESIHPHIVKALEILEGVVVRHANGEMYALNAPKSKASKIIDTEVV